MIDNLKRFAVTTYSDCSDLLEEVPTRVPPGPCDRLAAMPTPPDSAVSSFPRVVSAQGMTNRTTAATAMNSTSSRSHAVFTLEITERKGKELDATAAALLGNSPAKKKKEALTKITLIDLAGSERAKTAESSGVRLKEGGAINKSLSVLGNVIAQLAKQANDRAKDEEAGSTT